MASGTTVGFSPQYNGPSLFRLPLITMITVKKKSERNKQDKQVTNQVLVRPELKKMFSQNFDSDSSGFYEDPLIMATWSLK